MFNPGSKYISASFYPICIKMGQQSVAQCQHSNFTIFMTFSRQM